MRKDMHMGVSVPLTLLTYTRECRIYQDRQQLLKLLSGIVWIWLDVPCSRLRRVEKRLDRLEKHLPMFFVRCVVFVADNEKNAWRVRPNDPFRRDLPNIASNANGRAA